MRRELNQYENEVMDYTGLSIARFAHIRNRVKCEDCGHWFNAVSMPCATGARADVGRINRSVDSATMTKLNTGQNCPTFRGGNMKCDHLIGRTFNGEVYVLASEAMEAIAELKQAIHDAEMAKDDAEAANTEYREDIKQLKAKNEKLKTWMKEHFYCDEMLVVEKREHKATRRALWISRAKRANERQQYENVCRLDGWVHRINKWIEVERKCRAKAEEYK